MPRPTRYACARCGRAGCKLWREYQTILSAQTLLCGACALADQEKSIRDERAVPRPLSSAESPSPSEPPIDAEGYRVNKYGDKTDQIGWYIPAVPTIGLLPGWALHPDANFWGYTSVPPEAVAWWRAMPT